MAGSWRSRPTGTWFSRLWRPWSSINPLRRPGTAINQPKTVGIRDLVSAPEEIEANADRRWSVIGVLFALLFAGLIVRLVLLQVIEHKTAVASANGNALRVSTLPANRGYILDRNGNPLVTNVDTTEIQLSLVQAKLHPEVIGALALLTHQTTAQVWAKAKNVQYNPYQPAPIVTNADASTVSFIKLHPSEFPGVVVQPIAQRAYPNGGDTASQVLGYVGPITGQEIAANPNAGYQTNSIFGKTGIEFYYEHYLRGIDGQVTFRVNAAGSILGRTKSVAPRIGDTVSLNIDAGLQKALDGYLAKDIVRVRHTVDPISGKIPKAINGAAIVMSPTTGAIYAMSSFPSYNLNSFVNGLSQKTYDALLANGSFTNYPIQGLFTPGSTFKMITATAQLQTGIFSAYQTVNDTGTFTVPGCFGGNHGCVFHDDNHESAGLISLPMALTKSSDYYFYNLGYLFWAHQNRYGTEPIQTVAAKYGLSQYTNIDLPNEVQGRVDSPTVRKDLHAQAPKAFPNVSWYTGDNVEMAFGQGSTAVTPIEMASAYATFANGGTRYQPEVAAAIEAPGGKVLLRYGARVLSHVALPAAVRNPIMEGLIGVVNNPSGTAYYPFHHYATFNMSSFVVAGKTGTASNAYGQEPNSWFVSFAPAASPKYVVMCVIGQGGYGADAAAPVVAQTYNYLVKHPITPLVTTPNVGANGLPVTTTTKAPGATKHH